MLVGFFVGRSVGTLIGVLDGGYAGIFVGIWVETTDGAIVGDLLGDCVGGIDGVDVSAIEPLQLPHVTLRFFCIYAQRAESVEEHCFCSAR